MPLEILESFKLKKKLMSKFFPIYIKQTLYENFEGCHAEGKLYCKIVLVVAGLKLKCKYVYSRERNMTEFALPNL